MSEVDRPARRTVPGVGTASLAAVLFGVIFYISGVLDVSAEVVFASRIMVTLGFYTVALAHPGARGALRSAWRSATRSRLSLVVFAMLSLLLGVQLWLFSWAPLHGHALDASLGFLLLPLVMVLGARVVLASQVTAGQSIAVAIATGAVVIKVAFAPQTTWVTFVICLGFPTYFVLRRRLGLDGPMAFGLEMAILAPAAVALVFVTGAEPPARTGQVIALVAVGLAGAAAMVAYLTASRLLPLPLFGLLGYLEPVGLVVVALLLGERLRTEDGVVYALLAAALTVLAVEGYRSAGRRSELMTRDPEVTRSSPP